MKKLIQKFLRRLLGFAGEAPASPVREPNPFVYVPECEWTQKDREMLEAFLRSETGMRLDILMHNSCTAMMRGAMSQPTAAAKLEAAQHASGAWNAWCMAKNFTRIGVGADSDTNDDSADTGAGGEQ